MPVIRVVENHSGKGGAGSVVYSAISSVSNGPCKQVMLEIEDNRISEVVWWTGKLIRIERVQVFSDWCQLVSHPVIRGGGRDITYRKL
jgi:hypothetical protein